MNAQIAQPIPTKGGLSDADDRLRHALAAARMGIWELSLETGAQLFLSPELEKILGLQREESGTRPVSLLQWVYPADRRRVLRAAIKALRYKQDLEVEFRFCPPGGTSGWLLARGRACTGAEGGRRLLGVGMDITAQKLAEQEILRLNSDLERLVAERTTQLQATNKELETFCYSISHDLRAPLRSIRGFNEVLQQRYASKLDARGQEFLRRACESSHHMDELIDDLLKLSRVGRAELARRAVSLSELVEAIAAGLRDSEPARAVKFEIAPNLRASGDERLLRIVLENLVRNAWKFTSRRREARIEFGFTTAPERAFFVRDNGAGFDPAYAGRLFGAFQRLHSNSEFEGTGIGLATVQRIINRHGGRIWAEGAVDQGATFYFALPADEDI